MAVLFPTPNRKTKVWFDNTVFVIIADHNASVAGNTGLCC